MSFRKTANAIVSRPNIEFDRWMEELRTQHQAASEEKQVTRIAKTVLRKCDPKQYLLSHATIVASVDCYEPEKAPVGRFFNRDIECVRKFSNFRIKPECQSIINNNGDAWERSLLLSTYRTFIGAPNYLEHIQIPELSKGFIVDAIARDLGETCYIDILVATDHKHKMLISDILSENIIAMSMGCWTPDQCITLADGTQLPISQALPDMEVLTQSGNVKRIENVQIRENRWSMREVKVSGLHPVKSTDNHGYYAVPRESVEWTTSCRKARIPVPKAYPFRKIEVKDLSAGDIVATPIPRETVDPGISAQEARFLGIYVAEGYKVGEHGVGLVMGEKDRHVDEVLQIIDRISWSAGELKRVVNGEAVGLKTSVRRDRGSVYVQTRSSAVRRLVDRFVIGRHAKTKVLEGSVLQWPVDLQKSFIGGMIDGDGCVSVRRGKRKSASVHISTRSEHLANQLFYISLRCGVVPSLSSARRPGTKLVPGGAGIDYQIRLRNDGAAELPSWKVQDSRHLLRPEHSAVTGNKDRWIAGNHLYARIQSIRSFEYEGFVYDLQVEDDHTYVAGHVGVSNCISLFTTCNKCGNVAVDDTQLCPCILYDGKGSKFHDEHGVEHKLAELIGNVAVPNSNQFIEASWVRNPAFVGAQRRNILNPEASTVIAALDKASSVYEIRKDEKDLEGLFRAASRIAQDDPPADDPPADDPPADDPPADDIDAEVDAIDSGFDSGEEDADADADANANATSEPSPAPPIDKTQELMDKASQLLMENLVQNLAEKMAPKPEDVGTTIPGLSGANYNDNIVGSALLFDKAVADRFPNNKKFVKWASRAYRIVHGGGVSAIRAAGMTSKDLIVLSWVEDNIRARSYPIALYKLAMNVGPTSSFPSEKSFLAACNIKAGRILSKSEQNFLSWKGRIASLSVKF